MSTQRIGFRVNGALVEAAVEPRMTAVDFLRHELRLTGTHVGCEHGVCGACTIIVDGRAVRSCLLFTVQLHGTEVRTVEGLSEGTTLSPLQKAFHKHHALQCGFCTPGMLTTAHALLSESPNATRNEIREAIAGNICRCTGYVSIIAAIVEASEWYRRKP